MELYDHHCGAISLGLSTPARRHEFARKSRILALKYIIPKENWDTL